MSLLTTIEALEKAGATVGMIVAVVRAHEAEREASAAQRREKDAARQRSKRIRDGHAESRGQDVTSRESDEPSPRAQVVTPSSSLRSEDVVVGGVGDAGATPDDWPAGKADHHANLLIEIVSSPWLDPNKSPDLVTTRGRVAAWKRDGASWEHDVLPVVTGLCANRRSRISSWKFFDAAVSRSIAENRAALEIPIIGPRHERADHPATSRAARRGVWAEVLAEERGEGPGRFTGTG